MLHVNALAALRGFEKGQTMPPCYEIFILEMQPAEDPAAEDGYSLFLAITPTVTLILLLL